MAARRRDLIFPCCWIGLVFLFSFAGSCHWHYSSDHCKHEGGKCHHDDHHAERGPVRVFADTARFEVGASELALEAMELLPTDPAAPAVSLFVANREPVSLAASAHPLAVFADDVEVGVYDSLRLTVAGVERKWDVVFEPPLRVAVDDVAEVVVVFDRRAASESKDVSPAVWFDRADASAVRHIEGTLAWLEAEEIVVDLADDRGSIGIERSGATRFANSDGDTLVEEDFAAGDRVAILSRADDANALLAARVVRREGSDEAIDFALSVPGEPNLTVYGTVVDFEPDRGAVRVARASGRDVVLRVIAGMPWLERATDGSIERVHRVDPYSWRFTNRIRSARVELEVVDGYVAFAWIDAE